MYATTAAFTVLSQGPAGPDSVGFDLAMIVFVVSGIATWVMARGTAAYTTPWLMLAVIMVALVSFFVMMALYPKNGLR